MPVTNKELKLYYIGGIPGNQGEQFINVRGAAFVVPPPGHYVQVRQEAAWAILKRYPSHFTLDSKAATRAAGIPNTYRPPSPSKLSVAELEALLKQARERESRSNTYNPDEEVQLLTTSGMESMVESMREAAPQEVDPDELDVEDPRPPTTRGRGRPKREEAPADIDLDEIKNDVEE